MKSNLSFKLSTLVITAALIVTSPCLHADSIQPFKVNHGERLLILAPHPDDESLSAAGLAHRVINNGGSVRSVVVTAGDAYVEAIQRDLGRTNLKPTDFLKYGEERLEESRQAAKVLGNGSIRVDLLGFSDGSIYSMLVSHWNSSNPDKSGFTGFSHVPYREAEDRGEAQDGKALRHRLVKILNETQPTLIAFPDVMENDSDHAGLGMFTLLAINDWLEQPQHLTFTPRLLAYLIHWQQGWPSGSDANVQLNLSNEPLFLPDDLPLRGHRRTCFELNVLERNLKHNTLAQYQTQQRAMGAFLEAFVRRNECFTLLKTTDSQDIKNVVKQWQHVRKNFDSLPISRQRI